MRVLDQPRTILCAYCGEASAVIRATKKYCSDTCARRARTGFPKERSCRHCAKAFPVKASGDANRQYCSEICARRQNRLNIKQWLAENPGADAVYRKTRVAKNPGVWVEKARTERQAIIDLLGGKCAACGVDNPVWLHADYIPTCRGKPLRHQRHIAFVRANRCDFRLLCANHHYELTLTGKIAGTEITQ